MNPADIDRPGADPVARAMAGTTDHLGEPLVPRGCPFLQSAAGGWRLDLPTREHRCAAFSPSAPLAPEKQSRLCLTDAHTGCATYLASVAAREARLGTAPVERATRWGLARTTAVIEDPGGVRSWLLAQVLDPRRWPAIPAVLLVTTLLTLALSGFRADLPTTAVATSSTGPGPSKTPAPLPTAQPSAAPSPEPTAPASPAPTIASSPQPSSAASPLPSASFRTYKVKSGDALSIIASKFGTTVKAIADLNHITNPAQLHVGQVLLIP